MSYRNLPIDQVLSLLQQGDKQLLTRLITCAESNKKSDQIYISEILSKFKYSANMTRRIGITGSPGVGKSSLIEKIGFELIKQGRKLAIYKQSKEALEVLVAKYPHQLNENVIQQFSGFHRQQSRGRGRD